MANLTANARHKAQGEKPAVISPLALEAVRRIDQLFEIERAIERRKAVRQQLSAPLVANLEDWMREQRAKLCAATISPRPWTTRSSAGSRSRASSAMAPDGVNRAT
jgi:hypothetical protein